MDKETVVVNRIQKSILLKKRLKDEARTIVAIADEVVQALRQGKKVLLFGNGGSAADAEHIAAELVGKYARDRGPMPAIALTTNTSAVTAIANDFGYENIFIRQLQALVAAGDIVIGISTSGNSPNVLLAMEAAKRYGAITVAFTGSSGKLKESADYVLSVPSKDTPLIQEAHITVGHIICQLVEEDIFGQGEA